MLVIRKIWIANKFETRSFPYLTSQMWVMPRTIWITFDQKYFDHIWPGKVGIIFDQEHLDPYLTMTLLVKLL